VRRGDCAYIWDTAKPTDGVLAVAGSLTYGNVDSLEESLDERLPQDTGIRRLRADFGGVTECDPAGLAVLLTLRRHVDKLGIQVDLTVSPVLAAFLEQTGTGEHLTGQDGAARDRSRFA
jgi:ABC-type transporter Mla MlaB component